MTTRKYQIIPVSAQRVILFNRETNFKSPAYKRIGPKVGPYMKTFDGHHYGFMTIYRDVCPPRFSKLPEISEIFMFGFSRMQVNGKWGLVNSDGYDMLSAEYDEVYIISEDIVIVGNNGLYGLFYPNTGIITEIKYTDFEMQDGYILTFCNVLQGILLYDGTEVFEPAYKKVKSFYGMFLATTLKGKQVLNSSRWREKSSEADEFYPPVNGVLRARNCKYYAFIDEGTGKNITMYKYRDAADFNPMGFAYVKDGLFRLKMVDYEGKEHSNFKRIF